MQSSYTIRCRSNPSLICSICCREPPRSSAAAALGLGLRGLSLLSKPPNNTKSLSRANVGCVRATPREHENERACMYVCMLYHRSFAASFLKNPVGPFASSAVVVVISWWLQCSARIRCSTLLIDSCLLTDSIRLELVIVVVVVVVDNSSLIGTAPFGPPLFFLLCSFAMNGVRTAIGSGLLEYRRMRRR